MWSKASPLASSRNTCRVDCVDQAAWSTMGRVEIASTMSSRCFSSAWASSGAGAVIGVAAGLVDLLVAAASAAGEGSLGADGAGRGNKIGRASGGERGCQYV